MYNRYIPQPDGSYRRNRVIDAQPSPPPQPNHSYSPKPECSPPPTQKPECPPTPESERKPHRQQPCQNEPAGDFLRQLLPKNLDTGDLMIILLLLLMAGDCQEDRSIALLTLAIYLFM
jgi:hypothetical protein